MKFDKEFFNLGYLDRLSYKNTFIHNIDARVKVIGAIFYIIAVVSFPKYAVLSLVPFFSFQIFFMILGEIPVDFVFKRVFVVSPFIFFIAIFNPFLDRNTAFYLLGIPISYGILSFLSILVKFVLTVSIIIILISTTSFAGLCYAIRYFKVPEIFVNQLLFMYRYIFVLTEEAMRMVRAKELRSFNNKGLELKFYVKLAGNLLIRSLNRAERIYYAMLSRGYNGNMPYIKKKKLNFSDFLFILIMLLTIYLFRFFEPVDRIGKLMIGVIR